MSKQRLFDNPLELRVGQVQPAVYNHDRTPTEGGITESRREFSAGTARDSMQ